ncbi:hypothetical protein ACIRXL_03460 [Avibacterium paragallinarum]|uniref:hypothetical protein n=1 Tax=Avibacterium paragallinarum TaxID=728 RepID=UPI00397CAB91
MKRVVLSNTIFFFIYPSQKQLQNPTALLNVNTPFPRVNCPNEDKIFESRNAEREQSEHQAYFSLRKFY